MQLSEISKAKVLCSALISFIVAVLLWVVFLLNPAFAADECGADVGGVVTCSNTGGNPYASGITYTSPGATTFNIESGINIDQPAGAGLNAVLVDNPGAPGLSVNLANGVTITTQNLAANGVEVRGSDISIISGADIVSATGLYGWISGATSTGSIGITQLENSTITASGLEGMGIFALNQGTGSVTLTSSGNISTVGQRGYGINAWNSDIAGGDTTITLNATGSVMTDGIESVGLYSLNNGTGNASVFAHGTITTMQFSSDGILADIDTAGSPGDAIVVLSDTARVHTVGGESQGVWALNWGLGAASITSAATVMTEGDRSHGLRARIADSSSAATVSIDLGNDGSVLTTGASSHGLFADNIGTGAATVIMASGTSVVTTGTLSNGVNGVSGGALSFTQAASSIIAASGEQSFGVRLEGAGATSAGLDGVVSSIGQFGVGVGVSSTSASVEAEIMLGANAVVSGGWQAGVTGVGATTARPSAGVLIGSALSSKLTNFGIIGAGSDRAIAGDTAMVGNLATDNTGIVTGFIELAGGGTNVFNNEASGLFDIRHFADTDGDGVRDTKRVSISDFGAATSSFNNLSGAIVRLAPVVGEASTDGAGYYLPTTGIDSRALEAGYYSLARSGVAQGQFTNLGTFHNGGVIDLRGSAIGNTLVMTANASAGGGAGNGAFISDGGQLLLNTVLNGGVAAGGQTGSFSDVLVVDGTQMGTGPTTITIDRRGGAGAATAGNGILLVEVRDKAASAPGVFVLNGDFVADGDQAVVRGAQYYKLFHQGVAGDVADGNWYLRSRGLAPSLAVYEAYPEVLLPLIEMPTLQQRVGNRYWNTGGGTVVIENDAIWGRIEAAGGHYEPLSSISGAQFDTSTWKAQAGLDGMLAENGNGKLISGVTGNYGHIAADVTAAGFSGNIGADGYGFGGTLTWYGIDGFYADAQAQATWFDSALSSTTLGRALIDGNKGFGYALSLETGQRLTLDQHWTLTPQAQLVYANVRFDTFTDPFAATVSLSDGTSLRGRLGLGTEYAKQWKQEDGSVSRASGYAVANLYNEFLDAPQVDVSGMPLAARGHGLWGGFGLGGSYNWNDDKYSIHGEVAASTALAQLGDSFELGGTIGFRVKW